MKRSTERISDDPHREPAPPARPAGDDPRARGGEPVDAAAFAARVRSAVAEVVGSRSRPASTWSATARWASRASRPTCPPHRRLRRREPRAARLRRLGGVPRVGRPARRQRRCERRICRRRSTGGAPRRSRTDIANLPGGARGGRRRWRAFLPAPRSGIVADIMVNRHYPTEEAYLYALADAMREEYHAIADAGLRAADRRAGRGDGPARRSSATASLDEFRRATAQRVEALNHALEGIPEEQVRFHVCWGNYEGPHIHDVPLARHRRPGAGGARRRLLGRGRQPAPRPRVAGLGGRQAARTARC